ncbi:MAG: peptide chain release factor N(5)-glutamine methyltransferase [Bacteroidaceae bacterium]|nr:peptide chain release factor N(5)-glutamine methyltransferase [Bacteroidaceae bacterium]
MQNAECRMLNAECRMLNAECRMLNAECRMLNAECRVLNAECRVLDVGTGSGAIAITLAKELNAPECRARIWLSASRRRAKPSEPRFNVTAIDISDKALAIAQSNAEKLGADITFIKQDILATTVPNGFAVDQTATIFPCGILPSPCGGAGGGRAFDIIVSNPPYIMEKEQAEMSAHVLDHEPSLALFVPDSDPLRFYRAIADFALLHLSPGGMLFFEINPLCAEEMLQLLSDKGFFDIQLRKDQFGKQRMIKATRL